MKNRDFVVRRAIDDDISDILMITKDVFRNYKEEAGINYDIPALHDTYEHVQEDIKNKLCFVATFQGAVVGSVRVQVNGDGTAYLSRFGVAVEQQCNGVGAILLNAVDEAMQEFGIDKLYLHTASKLLSLIRFYYGKGFYIDSTTKDRGYIRALLCKEYDNSKENTETSVYSDCAV